MILWTIQGTKAWNIFRTTGILRTTSKPLDDYSFPAYQWMSEQTRMRLGSPPTHSTWPVWAWYQWQGEKRKKPDLRSRWHLPKGKRGVCIEFEIDENKVLLSDFRLWHYALNYWYLPKSESDGEKFEATLERHHLSFFKTMPLPEPKFHQAIITSWQRIFDLDWVAKGLSEPKAEKSIQATLWEIRREQVRTVREFIVR
jgi:hypothetical protein